MAHRAYSLKLTLPDTDPNTIPMLNPEQVNKMPSSFLGILYDIGDVMDLGDLKRITVDDESYYSIIKKTAEFYTTGHLQHGEIKVERANAPGAVLYRKNLHEQDASISATPETHVQFLEQIHLYIFCLHVGMTDFQAYLCEAICTQYPICEAEIVVLFTELYESPDILGKTDQALLGYLCQRIELLRNDLAISKPTRSLLRTNLDTKDRFMSIVEHLDEASITRALQACHIDEVTETRAMLNKFVEKYRSNTSAVQLPRQAIDNTIRAQHTHVRTPSSDRKITSHEGSSTPHSRKRPRSTAPLDAANITTTADTAERHEEPGRRSLPNAYFGKKLRLRRPTTEGAYFSITSEEWELLKHIGKCCYTHAGYICETEAGMIAPEPCEGCASANEVCEVYTPEYYERNVRSGTSCANCRTKKNFRCSFAEEKTRQQHSPSPLL